jgi:DNA-binding transcriptional ArsR family regulator
VSTRAAGAVFAALADPTRRAVLTMVGRRGPATATELAARLPVSRQAVTKHLDALHRAGLVVRDKQGRDVRYGLRPEPLDDAAAWMAAVGAAWDRRLAALVKRTARP